MLFSSSIVTCQLPLEPSARGALMPPALALPSEDRKSSRVSTEFGATESSPPAIHSELPRWMLTGTDQMSLPELTMFFRSLGMTLSQPSEFQMLVIGSILLALTQVLMSSWPAWTWKLSGGLPPCIRVASTALALLPAPPATAALTISTLAYFCL